VFAAFVPTFSASRCDAEEECNAHANKQIQVLTRIVAYLPVPGVGRKGAFQGKKVRKVEVK
jgi:hypothetical protein